MTDRALSTEDLIAETMALFDDDDDELLIDDDSPGTPPAASQQRKVTGYEEAAAVLGWFDPETLRPATRASQADLDALEESATPVIDDKGAAKLSIASSRRVDVLAHLRANGLFDRATGANPTHEGDLLGQLIRSYGRGLSETLDGKSLAELYSMTLVSGWLREAGFTGLLDVTQLQERIDLLELYEPFEIMAGSDFVGRKAELTRLHRFVTGRKSRAPRHGIHSWSEAGDNDARILGIYGPGGIGKSTVIAKALLELTEEGSKGKKQVLIAYLDFDRPTLDAGNDTFPLLGEILAQLAVQVPEAKAAADNIREAWSWRLERPPAERADAVRQAVDELATLLRSLRLDGRRIVVVLDTFEMVQRRSSEEAAAILSMVDLLVTNDSLPEVRVIVAGRAGVPRSYADNMEVAELDPASARQLLMRLGVDDRRLADRIVRHYGGDPLSLRLAAADPEAHGAVSGLVSRAFEWFRQLDESVIQRRLHERVLGHIEDADVRRLAQSGLVLRRLTPGIVLDVLAKPCGLYITTYEEAVRLWEELERETSLVQLADDGSLLHRPELRRLTLPLLEADQPELTQSLHRAAVAYYTARPPDPRERAEEIYHRLKSGADPQSVDDRWLSGVEPFLQSALDELSGRRRALLASRLGVTVDFRTTSEARTDDYEQITARKVRAMLNDGRPRDALTALSGRPERTAQSPLVALTAEAHFALGQVREALDTLGDAAEEALRAGWSDQAFQLSRLEAELVLSAGTWDDAPSVAERLRKLDHLVQAPLVGLACSALGAVMCQRGDPSEASMLRRESKRRFDQLADEALARDPSLVRLLGSLHVDGVDRDDVHRVSRVIRLAGLPRQLHGPVRVVAAELGSLDAAASAAHGEAPGMLVRRHRLRQSSSLTASWSAFLIGADDAEIRLALVTVLDLPGLDLEPLVLSLARLLGTDQAFRRPSGDYVGPERDVIAAVSLSQGDQQMLIDALHEIFTPYSLRWFLRLRLRQSLDALAPSAVGDFAGSISVLVRTLEERGLLVELVAHCREVAPGNSRLLHVADSVGLMTPLSGRMDTTTRPEAASGPDFRAWLEALGQLEGQVCRVQAGDDVKGSGFLVGPDVLLTSATLAERVAGMDVHCQFDAKRSREGAVVTPGVWYDVVDVVATGPTTGGPVGWALVRVGGSPGVQPIGGDRVESSTGTLRGWVDISRADLRAVTGELLCLSPDYLGSLVLTTGQAVVEGPSESHLLLDLPTSPEAAGGPLLGPDLTPVGVHLGFGFDPNHPDAAIGVTLGSVLEDLSDQRLDHLVRTALA
jgi:hypothetical protein